MPVPLQTTEVLALSSLHKRMAALHRQQAHVYGEIANRLGIPIAEIGAKYEVDLESKSLIEIGELPPTPDQPPAPEPEVLPDPDEEIVTIPEPEEPLPEMLE